MQVPLHLALTHQGFALVVLGFAAAHWRGTKGAYPLPGQRALRSLRLTARMAEATASSRFSSRLLPSS